ncbi:hypothetical protein [Flavobacterium franklandianum]|uniref:Uncharacterized protein n=1 Tax=Flavobacterium franklandianum TaxID=2594430 RepID=A0A553CM87_9FLAO|nr:hypothetical protein [Flavobacterium franklandianum]TRX21646.1 hypothetical protein FNW17_07125 [Flavobacterium franklandianum]
MKANIYYIFLLFLLALGGNHLFANTHQSAARATFSEYGVKHEQIKHKKSNRHSTINVVIDIDFDEEFHTNENQEEGNSNHLLANTNGFLNNWYLTFADPFFFKNRSDNFKISEPFSVHSNPIYLVIGDFRI